MEQVYRNATMINSRKMQSFKIRPMFYVLSFLTAFGLSVGEQMNEYFSFASKLFIIFGFVYSVLFLLLYRTNTRIYSGFIICFLIWITILRGVRLVFSDTVFSIVGVLEDFKVPLFIAISCVLFKSFTEDEKLLKIFLSGFLIGYIFMIPFGESSMYSTYLRTYGTYANPNTYAYDCILAVYAGIYLLITSRKFQLLKVTAVLVATIMLFRTQSRGALLAFFGGLLVLFLLIKPSTKKMLALLGVGIFLGIVLFIYRDTITEVLTRYSVDEISGNIRFEIWGTYLKNVNKFFWLGISESQLKSIHYYTTHNNFLASFVSYGVVGLFLYIGANISLLITLAKNRKIDKGNLFNNLAISLFVVSFFSGMTHETTLFRGYWVLFLLTCFLALHFDNNQRTYAYEN